MTPASEARTKALTRLRRGLAASRSGIMMDAKGYVANFRENLLPDIDLSDFEADLRQGSGGELEGKFRAAHSSSALAVNVFAPFRRRPQDLSLGGRTGFTAMQFERKCPTGLGGTPPNLDVVFEAGETVIAVESKCTEYLSPHPADFSPSYDARIAEALRGSPWFGELLRLTRAPETYRWLDAAQLIKHALGLEHSFPGRKVTLLYLFWQPSGTLAPIHAEHRAECQAFAVAVAGGNVGFAFSDYGALWQTWREGPGWLRAHVDQLVVRYGQP